MERLSIERTLEEIQNHYLELCKTLIKRPGIDELLDWIQKSDFLTAPASTRFHGNYEGGLVEHSINVYDALNLLAKILEVDLSPETIAVAALFHDVCKANFYKKGTRNVKNQETGKWEVKEVFEIDERFPMGHGEKSCIIIQQFMKLTVDELLAIRWHMGGFDSATKGGDYGLSKAYEMSSLAVLLQLADMTATYLFEKKV